MMSVVATPSSRTLVGRDAELRELASLLGVTPDAPTVDGRGTTTGTAILLAGDAGVGKTRLLTELRDLAVADGWQVVAGHCLDFGDSALPYLPFSEVLGRLATELPDVVDTVAGRHPALARLQPGRRVLASAPHSGGSPTDTASADGSTLERADLFEAVHALLDAAAEKAPLLVVVEDTHWADQSTRDLLSFLFTRPFLGPVAVVASYRSDDLHRRHPLRTQVAEWARLRGVERLQLQPLSAPDVRSLIHELHPEPLAEPEVSGIVERAEGNAFFVEELVGAASGPGRWVPEELADVLLVRLDQLGDDARQVVRAASVAGRRVSHDLLSAVADLPEGRLDDGLRGAVERNVLVAHERHYRFRHALLGEAVYDDLLPGERVRLHAAYVAALRDGRATGTAAELARHARLANDLDTALTASVRAGQEASNVGGPDEAAYHFQQALELLADPRRSSEPDVEVSKVAVSAGEALTASGEVQRAAAVLREQLDRLPADAPATSRARLLSALASVLIIIETEDDPVAVSAEAVALAPTGETPLRARILANHARILASWRQYSEAEGVGLDALALAERLDLQQLAAEVITTLSNLKQTGPLDGLRAALVEAVDARRGDRVAPGRAARTLLPRPLLPGPRRLRRGRALVPQRDRPRRRGRHPVGAVRLRGPLAAGLGAARARRLGRRAGALRHRRHRPAAGPRRHARLRPAAHRAGPRRRRGAQGPRAAQVLGRARAWSRSTRPRSRSSPPAGRATCAAPSGCTTRWSPSSPASGTPTSAPRSGWRR